MTGETAAGTPPGTARWVGRAGGWLRGSRGGLLAVALVVGAGSGLGAVAFRDLIYFFTWLATGHAQFGQQGRVGSAHFPWLGLGFFVVIPVIGGLIYGPLIYRYAREARGHGVPEVMIAVAENGGRIRPQVAAVKSVASAICIGAGGSVGREGPIVQIGSALASSLGQWVRMPENRLRILVACGAAGGIAATFNAPITGVFFGVEIILRELSVEAVFTVMLSAVIADLLSRQFLGSAPFLSGLPSGIALHHLSSYLLVAALAVIAALLGLTFAKILYATEDLCDRVLEERPGVGPARGRRDRARAAAARDPADVRGRLPGHVQGGRRQLRTVVPDRARRREDHRVQPDDRHRRIGRGVRPVAVHRRHLRHGLRRDRQSPARPGRRAACPVCGRRHGSGVRLRGPGPAHLGRQRRGDDRRLHPHPAGVARRGDRHRHLAGPELRHHLHHQTAAPRHRHRPPAISGPVRGPHRRRRHAPLRGAAHHRSRATRPAGPVRSRPGAAARPGHPAAQSAGAFRRGVPDPGAAPAGTLRPRRPAGAGCRRAAPARLDHQPERAARRGPPHAHRPGRHRAGPARSRPGPSRLAGRRPRGAHPAARLPDPGNHHPRGLARRRPDARRHHLAARVDPGHGHGQPHPPRRRPRHHAHPRRPGQPARPRTTEPRVLASPDLTVR